MADSSNLVKAVVAGVALIGTGGAAEAATPANGELPPKPTLVWEKCLGAAKAKANDCGSLDGRHSCSGVALKDNDPTEWIWVPKGICAKIAGGTPWERARTKADDKLCAGPLKAAAAKRKKGSRR